MRLSVLGPSDLLVTALVAGLRSSRVETGRMPLHEIGTDRSVDQSDEPRLLIVDVDLHPRADVVVRAVEAGMTVLAIGSVAHRERAAAAIVAGAVGWIAKTSSIDVLADAVRETAAGRALLTEQARAAWQAEYLLARDSVRAELDRLGQLSPREREVLHLLADGRRAAEIAELLYVSITTVRSHIRSVLAKLGVNSQQTAAEVYREIQRRVGRAPGAEPVR
ncbi:response regulator transcription factor [Pseudonocardia sp. KRD-184]|uniref:Response regulator transcription factor n=1 Tax=Pseudonocardia oceani TaxID=2792013 RepID=A0ABS6U678_9PSEU|nr:LuxR C-terminal-related transcriptional regulator [Pseudonocardia oceani]MBW0092929.1 response regulator transcription factor [Pseudonocardia oceani]MBW0099729.1 response regulator transcription factor [Pseudonocardia oceani]MBW0125640.1 response regulator transcription factor [Pseudonocardia oceani]MBW0127498.1 response regulator transcription factor [Pseudonocardia oceani]